MLDLRPNCECCDRDLPPELADAGSVRSSARSAATAPKACSAGVAPIAAANWCAGRSARRTGCSIIRPRHDASSSRKDAPGHDSTRVPTGARAAVHRDGRAARRQSSVEAAGADVIHLEVGQPGSSAPEPVLEAARRALADERIGYTDALGIAPLRQAIAASYQRNTGLPSIPPRSSSRPARRPPFSSPFSPPSSPATGSGSPFRAIRPIATS